MKKNQETKNEKQEMKNKKFKESFDKGYKEFLLSELLISLMEKDNVSIRELAKELNVSFSSKIIPVRHLQFSFMRW